jgi:hypothetical protein
MAAIAAEDAALLAVERTHLFRAHSMHTHCLTTIIAWQ